MKMLFPSPLYPGAARVEMSLSAKYAFHATEKKKTLVNPKRREQGAPCTQLPPETGGKKKSDANPPRRRGLAGNKVS